MIAHDRDTPGKRRRPPLWLRLFIGSSLALFLLGGLYSGYLFYATIREIVGRAELPAMPVVHLPSLNLAEPLVDEVAAEPLPKMPGITPVARAGEVAYAPLPASLVTVDRINVLLLGVDRRGGKGWGYRTDTIIIVTVDPVNERAGMFSIPRDLQVPIPGNGEDRINTANIWGESRRYPGGGPALLRRTVEVSFGIPVDYYVMVDFQGFEEIIDTLGGIDVQVPRMLHDSKYPDPQPGDPHRMKTVHFDAGWQHIDGARALEYVRSRMSTSDFDRARRQQQILIAVSEKALRLNLVPRLPSLFATMGDMVKTDVTLDEMLELAALAPQIDMESLEQVVIQKPMVYGYRREDGAAVQLPKWDLINAVVADLFAAPVAAVTATPTPPPPTPIPTLAPIEIEELQELAREGARIAVQNGTSEPNFAARVATLLMEQGYQVVEFGDADRLDYASTVIVDHTGKSYSLKRLVQIFQVAPENVRQSSNLRIRIDIRLIVGQDFLLLLP